MTRQLTFRSRMADRSSNMKIQQREQSMDAERCCVLPCWDEDDDGVPPFCRHADHTLHPSWWMLCNHKHTLTNHNRCCWVIGNIGIRHFDRHRRVWMAFAMWSTLLAMLATTYGCFALSTDAATVKRTHWYFARGTNATSGAEFDLYFGLRSAVIVESARGAGEPARERSLHFGSPPPFAHATSTSGNPLVDVSLARCRAAAVGNQFGALCSCAGLVFALIGTINRMRFNADANVQKTLGMVADSYGAISLMYTLVNFSARCNGPDEVGPVSASYALGPGWWCYMSCAIAGFVRAIMHWLTPVPGLGAGACTFELPKEVVAALDVNGDGHLDVEDLRQMFRSALDVNGDGQLDVEDLRDLCCSCACCRRAGTPASPYVVPTIGEDPDEAADEKSQSDAHPTVQQPAFDQ